jgi:hypothetical protein
MDENFFDTAVLEKIEANGGLVTRGAAYMLLKDFIIYTRKKASV